MSEKKSALTKSDITCIGLVSAFVLVSYGTASLVALGSRSAGVTAFKYPERLDDTMKQCLGSNDPLEAMESCIKHGSKVGNKFMRAFLPFTLKHNEPQ